MKNILKNSCALVAGLAFATAAQAGPCKPLAALLAPAPRFEDYPAPAAKIARPAPVDLRGNKAARRFRSALGEAQKAGPNFAGHYTIAGWGCGTGCLDWGVIDQASGKVTFDPRIRTLENLADDWDRYKETTRIYAQRGANKADFDQLLFRPDSALLITLGAPGEDGTREDGTRADGTRNGIAYWRWSGRRFTRVHFVPAKTICRED